MQSDIYLQAQAYRLRLNGFTPEIFERVCLWQKDNEIYTGEMAEKLLKNGRL